MPITPDKLELLVQSILVFPKMLQLRPVVIDAATAVAYGGNMRTRALLLILGYSKAQILEQLNKQTKFKRLTQFEQDELVEYWLKWQQKPYVKVQPAANLTEAEKAEFVIKDNVGFGKWDYDRLANEWDNDLLVEMGMDIWNTSDTNIDDFFTDSDADKKDAGLHITVSVPKELEAEMQEIKAVVEAAVESYTGVKVK